ncbi:hypothetical protein GALMADRAFT_1140386 [Galerina marginata CBS 339.88]|uniref:Uncharacterized protein n=1 Tax=Galerina marginata (strain CBS 339.88) TaxID=685588 RepID=A0A067SA02_GALM3|nr:hypothetical protein GALMADRAFT_1140386 [Galerina marginata CBS 339.88]
MGRLYAPPLSNSPAPPSFHFTPSTQGLCLYSSRCRTTAPPPTNVGCSRHEWLQPARRTTASHPSLSFLCTLVRFLTPKPSSFTVLDDNQLLVILSPAARPTGEPIYLHIVSPNLLSVWVVGTAGIGDPPAPSPVATFGKSGQDNGAVGGSWRWEAGLAINGWAFDGRELEYSLTSKDREEHRARTRDWDG